MGEVEIPSGRVTASTESGSRAKSSARAVAYDTAPVSFASSLIRTVGWCSSLSATRRTESRTSARASSSRSGSRAVRRSISASTTAVAIDRSATTVGVTLAWRRAERNAATSCPTMLRTPSTSWPASLSRSSSARSARVTRVTPGSSATAGSTSCGRARSTIASGRPSGRAVRNRSASTRTPVAPVQAMRRSALASVLPSSDSGAGWASYSRARRSALTELRFTTVTSAASSLEAVAVARPAMAPAPTMTTRLPATPPSTPSTRARPALTRDGAAWSMSVSARERLPTRSACWKSTLRAGPTVPCSWPRRSASRVWPRICPSPTAIESRPAATWNRCETAPSS